jgi:cytochrome c-type biogenesis protein CcmH
MLLVGTLRADDQEAEARAIERLLVAPCCFRQAVVDHFSPEADQVRQEVRRLLAEGKERQEILDLYVARYGTAVLVKPPFKGFSLLGYLLPVAVLAAVGVWLLRYVARRPVQASAQAQTTSDPEYSARLAQELRERDN